MPTSLTYIILSTRGCSPWRPDAVMSTTGAANTAESFQRTNSTHLRRIFKDRHERTGHDTDGRAFPPRRALSPGKPIPGRMRKTLKRKENSFQGSCWRLRLRLCCHDKIYPSARFGNINPIPFRQAGFKILRFITPSHEELPRLLGSTNPCPNAVHKEPFSTSAIKVLI